MNEKNFTLWFTGLPSAGKTTLAKGMEKLLRESGRHVVLFDGDAVRARLWPELGFSRADRETNIRRLGHLCELFSGSGIAVIVAAISPYRSVREEIKLTIPNFFEVYVECPLDVLVQRDVKGLYKKALSGEIKNFTGVSDPYEAPLAPELVVHSNLEGPKQSLEKILAALEDRKLVAMQRQVT